MGIDFDQLNSALNSSAESLLHSWLPGGKMVGREFVAGSIDGEPGQSFKFNVDKGCGSDFATGHKFGDLIDVYAGVKRLAIGEAAKELSKMVLPKSVEKLSEPTHTLVPPGPDVRKPLLRETSWCYRSAAGEVLFYVERIDVAGGKKEFKPHSYNGKKWVNKMWAAPRPLYGLELLRPGQVLVVEGEKTCDAARSIVGNKYSVVTWAGGASAVAKADWSVLAGRDVLLWPDNDDAGKKAMANIKKILVKTAASCGCLDVSSLPAKADAADLNWTYDKFLAFVSTKPSRESEKSENYEQIGFYFRYMIPDENTGKIKTVDVPKYKVMADWCFEQKNMCFDDSTSMIFDGKKWNWLSKHALSNFIITKNEECIKPGHMDGFVKMIRGKCLVGSVANKNTDGLINVNNGIIDVRSGELLPHSHEYLFKYCSPVDFSTSATSPLWEKFLLETFCNDVGLIDLAQRLFGYILIGGRPFLHKAFVLFGSGRNGKSTFLDVLRAVLGSESYSTVSMAKLDREFSVVALDGKLANIVEETPTTEINAEAFKNLVGGGQVQASRKGQDEYTIRCNARFVFACNEMPNFKDRTVGLEERLVFIPFNRFLKEDERDTEITEKLLAELSGIFNWALEGAKIILRDRKLPHYEATADAKDMYRIETDPLYAWFKERITIEKDSKGEISCRALYKKYSEDCESSGNRPYSKDRFLKRFRKMISDYCSEHKITYDAKWKTKAGERGFNIFTINFVGDLDA